MSVSRQRKYDVLTTLVSKALGVSTEQLQQSFKPALPEDITEIMALRKTGFTRSENKDLAIIKWKYFSNQNEVAPLYVLRLNNQIIACLGMLPITLNTSVGKKVEGVMLGDILVHPQYARIGIGGWMLMFAQVNHAVAMAMHGNASSEPILKKLFQTVQCRVELKFVYSSRYYFLARQWPSWLATSIDICWLRFLRKIGSCRLPRFSSEYSVREYETSDYMRDFCEHEIHSESMGKTESSYISIEHSSEFLKWRFDNNPVSSFKHIVVSYDNACIGYAIVKLELSSSQAKTGYLMDWKVKDGVGGRDILRSLFAEVLRFGYREKIDFLSVMTTDQTVSDTLHSLGYSVRDTRGRIFVHADPHTEHYYSGVGWHLNYADTEEVL